MNEKLLTTLRFFTITILFQLAKKFVAIIERRNDKYILYFTASFH